MIDKREAELRAALRDAFPKVSRRALPIAIKLASRDQQNFNLTLALIAALRRRTRAEIDAQRAKWGDTLDKRDARIAAVMRAIESLPPQFQSIERGGRKAWPHGAQKKVRTDVLSNDGIDVSPNWLSNCMRHLLMDGKFKVPNP
jgi:hypothetical protein